MAKEQLVKPLEVFCSHSDAPEWERCPDCGASRKRVQRERWLIAKAVERALAAPADSQGEGR